MAPSLEGPPLLDDRSVAIPVTHDSVIQLFGFLAAIWAAGQFANVLKITPLVRARAWGSLPRRGASLEVPRKG